MLNSLLMLLQGSALGDMVRNAQYLYPVLEAIHILGIALLVGPAFAFDLRLLGVANRVVSVPTAARHLLPVSHVGLAIAFVTGIVLLSAQATVVANTGAAPWKLGLLILAGLNVPIFHYGVYRQVDEWAEAAVTPIAARAAAVVSMVAWIGVILSGRLLAYT
ncbi:hypothetical protein QO002_001172 [Pararhizobium capsulatum DSM 1112]|uniref:DUF6644 domain-containing protein n=1 Tax=Pararhizobium capsulatum DSM 1112 TaxID=1121113 RepID=A0ABU0BLA6_9HYPH|nr:DUF6644 family protein [Pararhizobium capsulatum]MDQ0319034.1 hypothetical protein [Pararhizobium capsulatum DSM 1112]